MAETNWFVENIPPLENCQYISNLGVWDFKLNYEMWLMIYQKNPIIPFLLSILWLCRRHKFCFLYNFLYCLDATDLKLGQLIRPAARGILTDEMTKLGVWHIPYPFRDVQDHLLASAQDTWVQGTLLYVAYNQQAAEFLLMKVNFENFCAPQSRFWPQSNFFFLICMLA